MLSCDGDVDHINHDKLVMEQENDPDLTDLSQRSLTFQKSEEVPVCFLQKKTKKNGVLMRKWRLPDAPANEECQVVHQVVVLKVHHKEIISIAHDSPMAGHLGVRKTHDRILNHFWWPKLRKDVSEYCRSYHTCRVSLIKKIPAAPLKPIPAFNEPFRGMVKNLPLLRGARRRRNFFS